MELQDIAKALVDGCRDGTETANLDRLYAPHAVSIEPFSPDGNRVTEGLDGIKGKHAWWKENFTVHSAKVEGPFPNGDDQFAVIFSMDAEEKASGNRHEMTEVGVYTVEGGQIVKEQFFYGS